MTNNRVKQKKKHKPNNWQIFMGWFIGFIIIGFFLPAIISINLGIGISIWIIVTLGDLIFFKFAISKFIINLFI